jgi:hypothetical protein
VFAACCSLNVLLPDESVERAICRSSRCFHRAAAVSSWNPPVGRGSWGSMPLARHTAISPMSAVLRWLPGAAQTGGPGRHLGRRDLRPGRRGLRPAGIAWLALDKEASASAIDSISLGATLSFGAWIGAAGSSTPIMITSASGRSRRTHCTAGLICSAPKVDIGAP